MLRGMLHEVTATESTLETSLGEGASRKGGSAGQQRARRRAQRPPTLHSPRARTYLISGDF